MAKKTNNKEAKPIITEKPKAIDWASLPAQVTIIATGGKHLEVGKEYIVGKAEAEIIINKGVAKLK